jgi:hypothetical protein
MWREVFVWGYRILVKVYDEPTGLGIKELPRISKMAIYNGRRMVASFDRGWDFNDMPKFLYDQIVHAMHHVLDLALGVFL